MSAVVAGWPGLRAFLGRLIRWRVGLQWYVIVLGIPILVCLIAAGIVLALVDRSQVSAFSSDKLRELPERFIFTLLFVGLGEEPGWRGFALPELQTRHTPLVASLILAPVWALWHLPLIGNEFPWPIVAPFIVSVFGGTFMLTWIFNRTKGSVFMTMLLHATINTVGAGLIFPLFSGTSLITLWWIYSLAWLAMGLAVLVFRSSQPGQSRQENPRNY
jgi:membrane protease YdiL (CAAX protease family)